MLNGIQNRVKLWQCVSIPSKCPHAIINDTEEEVIIAWTYLSNIDKVNPDNNYNWTWLEEVMFENETVLDQEEMKIR